MTNINRRLALVLAVAALAVATVPASALAGQYSAWGAPHRIDTIDGNSAELTTAYTDGCAMQSPDALTLYFASNRPRFVGDTRTDLDIYVSHRASSDAAWGDPENLTAVNTTANEFCPTPTRGGGLFFVRSGAGDCGGPTDPGDIYFTRRNPTHGWSAPENLGCEVNSALGAAGPSYFETSAGNFLYFSDGPDIYSSEQAADGSFGSATPVAKLNSASNDFRPNVRKDGLEMVFDSNRPGGYGGLDLWTSTRASVNDPWSAPTNLGSALNTSANEARASFSWDATILYFGRTGGVGGSMDIWVTTRKSPGN